MVHSKHLSRHQQPVIVSKVLLLVLCSNSNNTVLNSSKTRHNHSNNNSNSDSNSKTPALTLAPPTSAALPKPLAPPTKPKATTLSRLQRRRNSIEPSHPYATNTFPNTSTNSNRISPSSAPFPAPNSLVLPLISKRFAQRLSHSSYTPPLRPFDFAKGWG